MSLSYVALSLRDDSLAMERLDGEVIIVDFESGHYYSFRGPAADVLWLVDHTIMTDMWPELLGAGYPSLDWSSAESGVMRFLDRLIELRLIKPLSTGSTTHLALPDDVDRATWVDPEMLVNDELADLLVIDPIHDVSDDGWPATPEG